MRSLILSLRAIILIAREQRAREKMYNSQTKLTDFYNKYKEKQYDLKELVKDQILFFKEKL